MAARLQLRRDDPGGPVGGRGAGGVPRRLQQLGQSSPHAQVQRYGFRRRAQVSDGVVKAPGAGQQLSQGGVGLGVIAVRRDRPVPGALGAGVVTRRRQRAGKTVP